MPTFEVIVKRTLVLNAAVLVEADSQQEAAQEMSSMHRDGYLGYIKWESVDSQFTWKCTESKSAVDAIKDITDRVEDV